MKHNNILKYSDSPRRSSFAHGGLPKRATTEGRSPEVEATKVRAKKSDQSHILPGKVVVKLKPADPKPYVPRADTRSVVPSSAVQESLSRIGAVHMEPLFADYDAYRERRK